MIRIVLRIFLSFFLVVNLAIIALSAIFGVNIYKKFGMQMLKVLLTLILIVIGFYLSLALLGIS